MNAAVRDSVLCLGSDVKSRAQDGVQSVCALITVGMLWIALSGSAQAQTVVRVDTSIGSFSLELYDDVAPVTVRNFVNYVITGRYDGTFIHRSEPGFVIQGGWLTPGAEEVIPFQPIALGPTIVNEYSRSNTRGTIAMAKSDGDPNSATSQWFINLDDNTGLDNNNGGFTAFGEVLGDGMAIVDAIAGLQRGNIGDFPFSFPIINYDGNNFSATNLVTVNMTLVNGDFQLPNRLETSGDRVSIKVAGGAAGNAEVGLRILQTEPEVIVEVDTDSIVPLDTVETGFSIFDPAGGQLLIPELDVAGQVAFRNLLFNLSDAANLRFTLQSYEE